jgi:nicotinate dehydrogenase subunit B
VPTAAAIANAFFDPTGVCIRQAPMTPARVRAALKAACSGTTPRQAPGGASRLPPASPVTRGSRAGR